MKPIKFAFPKLLDRKGISFPFLFCNLSIPSQVSKKCFLILIKLLGLIMWSRKGSKDPGEPLGETALCDTCSQALVSIILDIIQGNLIIACPWQPCLPSSPRKGWRQPLSSDSLCQINSEQAGWNTPKEASNFPLSLKETNFSVTLL